MLDDEPENQLSEYKNLPIFIKATEILELSNQIATYIDDAIEKQIEMPMMQLAQHYVKELLSNAFLIPSKIAGASGATLYDLKMENAAIIRKAARELNTACTGILMLNIPGMEYLVLINQEIENFRLLFVDWVKSFDIKDYIIDRWGLFNPPGVNFDDLDI